MNVFFDVLGTLLTMEKVPRPRARAPARLSSCSRRRATTSTCGPPAGRGTRRSPPRTRYRLLFYDQSVLLHGSDLHNARRLRGVGAEKQFIVLDFPGTLAL